MPHINVEILLPVVTRYLEGTRLTPAERAEVLRMAQAFAGKDSAAAANVSPETIRARRKRIYRKLDISGAGELISALLALSLQLLVAGQGLERHPNASTQPQPADGPAVEPATELTAS